MNKTKAILTFLVALAMIVAFPVIVASADEPDNELKPLPESLSATGEFHYMNSADLEVGMDDGHFADYGLNVGFKWPSSAGPGYEHLASGWWAEGFYLGYSGGASWGGSNEDHGTPGITGMTENNVIVPGAYGENVVTGNIGSLYFEQTTRVNDNEHDAFMTIKITNKGTTTISDIHYKRFIDWDMNRGPAGPGSAGDDHMDFYTYRGATFIRDRDGVYGQHATVVAPAEGCSNQPTDWNAHSFSAGAGNIWTYSFAYLTENDPNDAIGDWFETLGWEFALAPGETYEIKLFYLVDNSDAGLKAQYDEMFKKFCQHPLWQEINEELDALIENVSAATMPSIIKHRLVDKLEYAEELKHNAKIECEAGNFDGATKKLGVAKSQVESFASMVKITRRISPADKASFLAESAKIIDMIDELIEYIETEHRC